jgi:hypothetical protein
MNNNEFLYVNEISWRLLFMQDIVEQEWEENQNDRGQKYNFVIGKVDPGWVKMT